MANIDRRLAVWLLAAVCLPLSGCGWFRQQLCGHVQAASRVIQYVNVPGHPFGVVTTADGDWAFVSMMGSGPDGNGIAVLRRSQTGWAMLHDAHFPSGAAGMALTHDGRYLIAAAQNFVIFFSVAKLEAGAPKPSIGWLSDGKAAGSIYCILSADDRTLYVADEDAQQITVIDAARAVSEGVSQADIVGRIPTGIAPVGLALPPDGARLYATSELPPPGSTWPVAPNKAGGPPTVPDGALLMIDTRKAITDPAHAVLAMNPAGCSPVRVALSPDGDRAYVTARSSNALLVLDTAKLASDPAHSTIATVPVGSAPVGVAIVDNGGRAVVANSNRIADANENQTLSVVDPSIVDKGAAAVVDTIPAGSFPREIATTPDGGTLIVTNFNSNTVEFITPTP